MGRGRDALLLALLLALGAWPWVSGLNLWPATADPPVWIGKGVTTAEGWARWVFLGPHFSWYRPVTALSFTVNELVTGLSPVGLRAVDLLLHLACAALLFLLSRALAPKAPRWVAFAAAGLLLAHPAVEEVVPYVARRSYTLATGFGLAALLAVARGRALLAAPLLFLALLSNEAAIVYAALAPCVARLGSETWRAAARASVAPLIGAGAALALRTLALGGLGGYGEAAAKEGAAAELASVWSKLLALPTDAPWPAQVLALAVGLFYLGAAVRTPRGRLLAGWLLGTWGLMALTGLWFERQLYLLAVPFALLAADTLGATRKPLAWLPQLLAVGCVLAHSPLARGPDPARMERNRERHAAVEELYRALLECEAPAYVVAALPASRGVLLPHPVDGLHRSARQTAAWTRVLLHQRDLVLVDAVYHERGTASPVRLELDPRPVLVVTKGAPFYALAGSRYISGEQLGRRRLPLDALSPPPGRAVYVYAARELTPVP